MKHIFKTTLLVFVLTCITGCTTGYWVDRGRDAADIFTVTAGIGLGGKARVGPLTAGLFNNTELVGIRGGKMVCTSLGSDYVPNESILPVPLVYYNVFLFAKDDFRVTKEDDPRHKSYEAISFIPLISWVDQPDVAPTRWYYNTQIEVAAGLIGSVRLGFNPGELVDFLLGFVGIDLYDDDLERRGKRLLGQ